MNEPKDIRVIDTVAPGKIENSNINSPPLSESGDVAKSRPKDPSPFSKPCSLCQRQRDVLIRCQIDESKKWNFVCPGKCWTSVTGGFTGPSEAYPHYVYGGTWKNKHEYVSGKIKGKAKENNKDLWNGTPGPHRNRGSRTKKLSKKDLGQSRIGIEDDDGGSDIEVSDLSDWSEGNEEEYAPIGIDGKTIDENPRRELDETQRSIDK